MSAIGKRTVSRSVVGGAIPLLLFVLVPGCATFMPVDDVFRHRQTRLEVSPPGDWLQYTPDRPHYTMTRDGLRLEFIAINVTKAGQKLQGTDRVYRADMLPYEVAELAMGVLEASDITKNFDVERIQKTQALGQPGFKAEATFTDALGLRKRLRSYGTIVGDYVCEFRYIAAESVYFDRYLETFERTVASARLRSS